MLFERSWPLPILKHLHRLTDDCGVIQHATFWLPDYAQGYCVDDNSRALLVADQYFRLFGDETAHELMVRYLAFIHYVQHADGRVRNFVGYNRMYLEEDGSPDSLGRTIWALGQLSTIDEYYLAVPAREMLQRAWLNITPDAPPHSLAYTLLGICAVGKIERWREEARALAKPLADALLARYRAEHVPDWRWFLPELTYDNGRLPEALLLAGTLLQRQEMIDAALESLAFLNGVCYRQGILSLVGCHGWYPRGGACAPFDQQPIDAGGMVEVNIAAYRLTQASEYLSYAVRAMDWFYGLNLQQTPLYNAHSGGCHDGLHAHGVNENQGAESTIVHLLAQLSMYQLVPELFAPELPGLPAEEDAQIP